MSPTRITSRTVSTGRPNSSPSKRKVMRWSCAGGSGTCAAAASAASWSANSRTPRSAGAGVAGVLALRPMSGRLPLSHDAGGVENAGDSSIAQDGCAGHDVGAPECRVEHLHHDVLVADQPIHQQAPVPRSGKEHHEVVAWRGPGGTGAEQPAAVRHVDGASPPHDDAL